MTHKNNNWRKKIKKWHVVVLVIVIGTLAYLFAGRQTLRPTANSYTARLGNLPINVLEGGSVEALESQEIRCQIKGYQGTKILSIVEEGYLVTEQDITNGKVLVELDSSELKQKITTQEIQFQSTVATLIDAQQAYEIQYNQNKTDLQESEQKVRFARMDFEKFLGTRVTKEVLDKLDLHETPFTNDIEAIEREAEAFELATMRAAFNAQFNTNNPTPSDPSHQGTNGNAGLTNVLPAIPASNLISLLASKLPAAPATMPSALTSTNRSLSTNIIIDFSQYADPEKLEDGSAKQQLRKLQDDLKMAEQELALSKTRFEGSKRLAAENFITGNELENEKLTVDRNDLKVQTAKTALDLYIKYEFVKTSQEYVSKYNEMLRALDRTRRQAVSKLAQARARAKSFEGRYRIESDQNQELYEQLSNCVIRAERPGLVVYGGSDGRRYFGGDEQIREGATVRERQSIITIPDMTRMSVLVKIHESHIKKITKGLKAVITVDSFPDQKLNGEVVKVGVLPDSQNRWMNPDMKVYLTSVSIDSVQDWLKPGMSAKVEILVRELTNVVYVPLQAIVPVNGKQYCFIAGSIPEQREVEVGEFNDEFIEVVKGLKEGEKVLLRAPEGIERDSSMGGEDKGNKKDAKKPGDTGGTRKNGGNRGSSGGNRPGGASQPAKGNR